MAYVPTNPDDDEEQRRAAASNAPGSFGDTTPTSTPTKTNFVNVSDYLSKNPGASEALGDMAAGKLATQRDETIGALNTAKSSFGQQVQSGGAKLDPDLLESAFSSPETFVQNSDNLAKFNALKDASYKGPESVQTSNVFAPTQSKVTALQQTGEGIGTEAGRTELVHSLSTNPTKGKSSLNQLLLQGNPAAAQKISDTAGTFKSVDDQWQDFLASTPAMVNQAKSETNQAREATRSGLDSATQQFMSQLDSQTQAAANQRDAFNLKYQNIDQAIAQGGAGLSQEQLADLGIGDAYPFITKLQSFNDPSGLGYYGSPVQLSNYMTPGQLNTNVPTRESVATPEQYAREAALQQMAGYDLGLPDQQGLPYQATGKLPTLDYMSAFNKAGADLQAADKAWQPKVAGYGPDDLAQLYAIQGRTNTPGYYTDPTVGATPTSQFGITPPPAGWDSNQPVPYPQPTSNPPSNLINPQWNPYTGQWEGVQLQPNNPPPPPPGGGFHTF